VLDRELASTSEKKVCIVKTQGGRRGEEGSRVGRDIAESGKMHDTQRKGRHKKENSQAMKCSGGKGRGEEEKGKGERGPKLPDMGRNGASQEKEGKKSQKISNMQGGDNFEKGKVKEDKI